MDLHPILQLLFVCTFLVGHYGFGGGSTVSKNEDLDLEKQLKLLNKPAVKTIETEYGDIYDCVDFYKQPAFDHPLLKNHTFHFQMKPTSLPKRKRVQISSNVNKRQYIGLKGGGCPVGTVPIRRITKEDLIRERARLASKVISPMGDNKFGAHYAVVRTKAGSNSFNGVGATLSLHNPPVTTTRYSAARLQVQNGPDSIQVGWRVDPSLYGDNRTRLFICFEAGQSGCFNTRCPGFVFINQNIPLDFVFPRTSQRGGSVFETELYIVRDTANGNWFVEVGDEMTVVGFWPKRIFSGLSNSASNAEWGGEVYASQGISTPSMGSGHFPTGNTRNDAYFRLISVYNQAGNAVDAYNTQVFTDNAKLYSAKDVQNAGNNFRHLVLYGGPSGS